MLYDVNPCRYFYDEGGNEIHDRQNHNRHTRENTYFREDRHHERGYRNQRVRPRYDRREWDGYVYPRHPRGRGDYYLQDVYRNDFNNGDYRNQRGYYHNRNQNYTYFDNTNFDRRNLSGNSRENQHIPDRRHATTGNSRENQDRPDRGHVTTGNWGGYPDELGWGNYPKEYSWEKKSFDRKRNTNSSHDQAGPADGCTPLIGCKGIT